MEHRLTKKYRLVWNEKTKEIIVNGEFESPAVTYTGHSCFETDELEEIEKTIELESLIEKKES